MQSDAIIQREQKGKAFSCIPKCLPENSFWPWPRGMWDRSSLTGDQTCATCTSCQAGDTQETQVQPLGQEDPLEKGMATHCSILAWEIP